MKIMEIWQGSMTTKNKEERSHNRNTAKTPDLNQAHTIFLELCVKHTDTLVATPNVHVHKSADIRFAPTVDTHRLQRTLKA